MADGLRPAAVHIQGQLAQTEIVGRRQVRPLVTVNLQRMHGRSRDLIGRAVAEVGLGIKLAGVRNQTDAVVHVVVGRHGADHALQDCSVAVRIQRPHPGLDRPVVQSETMLQRQLDPVASAIEVNATHHQRVVAVSRAAAQGNLLTVGQPVIVRVTKGRVGVVEIFLSIADAVTVEVFVTVGNAVVVAVRVHRVGANLELEQVGDPVLIRVIGNPVIRVWRELAGQVGRGRGRLGRHPTMPHTARVKLHVVTTHDDDLAVNHQLRVQFHGPPRPCVRLQRPRLLGNDRVVAAGIVQPEVRRTNPQRPRRVGRVLDLHVDLVAPGLQPLGNVDRTRTRQAHVGPVDRQTIDPAIPDPEAERGLLGYPLQHEVLHQIHVLTGIMRDGRLGADKLQVLDKAALAADRAENREVTGQIAGRIPRTRLLSRRRCRRVGASRNAAKVPVVGRRGAGFGHQTIGVEILTHIRVSRPDAVEPALTPIPETVQVDPPLRQAVTIVVVHTVQRRTPRLGAGRREEVIPAAEAPEVLAVDAGVVEAVVEPQDVGELVDCTKGILGPSHERVQLLRGQLPMVPARIHAVVGRNDLVLPTRQFLDGTLLTPDSQLVDVPGVKALADVGIARGNARGSQRLLSNQQDAIAVQPQAVVTRRPHNGQVVPLLGRQRRNVQLAANRYDGPGSVVDPTQRRPVFEGQLEALTIDPDVREDVTGRLVLVQGRVAGVHPDSVIRHIRRAKIIPRQGRQLPFIIQVRIHRRRSVYQNVTGIVATVFVTNVNPDAREVAVVQQLREPSLGIGLHITCKSPGDRNVRIRGIGVLAGHIRTVNVNPDITIRIIDQAVDLVRSRLIRPCWSNTGQDLIEAGIVLHVRGTRIVPDLHRPWAPAELEPAGLRHFQTLRGYQGRVQTARSEVGPAHRMNGARGHIHFRLVAVAVVIRIRQTRIRASALLLAVGQTFLVEVLVTIHDPVVVRVVVKRIGTAVVLIEVIQTVTVGI